MRDTMYDVFIGILMVAGTVFISATFTGTILCLIYPHIHALFPTAAELGIIPYKLGWWDSVCITWIFSLLLKSNIKVNGQVNKK